MPSYIFNLLLLFGLHRIAFGRELRFFPSGHAAEQRGRVIHPLRLGYEHRTGARVFGRSSAVEDYRLLLWQLLYVRAHLVEGKRERALYVLSVVCALRASVVDDCL